MVKNKKIYTGILAASILVSPLVSAKTDYPAANFQPKVLYSDSDYKHNSSATGTSQKAKRTEFDANYPAATFEPKVVYQDASYKHKKNMASTVKSSSAASSTGSREEESASSEQGSSDQSMLIGLIVLAGLGFYFFRKKAATAPKKAPARTRVRSASKRQSAPGVTGVAKYLEGKESKVTGVAKYLAGKESTTVTGVAKYVAKQVVAAKKAAAENITGVEKYLRNKG